MTHASNKTIVQPITGTVVSDKMDKTVVVEVHAHRRHSKYHKSYTVTKRYKAHDAENQYRVGDEVVIASTKPISKDKRFVVLKKA